MQIITDILITILLIISIAQRTSSVCCDCTTAAKECQDTECMGIVCAPPPNGHPPCCESKGLSWVGACAQRARDVCAGEKKWKDNLLIDREYFVWFHEPIENADLHAGNIRQNQGLFSLTPKYISRYISRSHKYNAYCEGLKYLHTKAIINAKGENGPETAHFECLVDPLSSDVWGTTYVYIVGKESVELIREQITSTTYELTAINSASFSTWPSLGTVARVSLFIRPMPKGNNNHIWYIKPDDFAKGKAYVHQYMFQNIDIMETTNHWKYVRDKVMNHKYVFNRIDIFDKDEKTNIQYMSHDGLVIFDGKLFTKFYANFQYLPVHAKNLNLHFRPIPEKLYQVDVDEILKRKRIWAITPNTFINPTTKAFIDPRTHGFETIWTSVLTTYKGDKTTEDDDKLPYQLWEYKDTHNNKLYIFGVHHDNVPKGTTKVLNDIQPDHIFLEQDSNRMWNDITLDIAASEMLISFNYAVAQKHKEIYLIDNTQEYIIPFLLNWRKTYEHLDVPLTAGTQQTNPLYNAMLINFRNQIMVNSLNAAIYDEKIINSRLFFVIGAKHHVGIHNLLIEHSNTHIDPHVLHISDIAGTKHISFKFDIRENEDPPFGGFYRQYASAHKIYDNYDNYENYYDDDFWDIGNVNSMNANYQNDMIFEKIISFEWILVIGLFICIGCMWCMIMTCVTCITCIWYKKKIKQSDESQLDV
eukprot:212752_1